MAEDFEDKRAKNGARQRPSSNPYANIGDEDDTSSDGVTQRSRMVIRPTQAITVMERWTQPSGNPCANMPQTDDEKTSALGASVAHFPGLSKAEFIAHCRRVFRQYMPALERKGLRVHHRDFITRNQSSAPQRRYRLVQHLEKYDLSHILGLAPQFNRERDPLTETKLGEIERLADSEG